MILGFSIIALASWFVGGEEDVFRSKIYVSVTPQSPGTY